MSNITGEEEMKKIAESRLQKLIWHANVSKAIEIKIRHYGVEITVSGMVPTTLMRAAVSLHDCYPDGGVYVVSCMDKLVLCVYYKSTLE